MVCWLPPAVYLADRNSSFKIRNEIINGFFHKWGHFRRYLRFCAAVLGRGTPAQRSHCGPNPEFGAKGVSTNGQVGAHQGHPGLGVGSPDFAECGVREGSTPPREFVGSAGPDRRGAASEGWAIVPLTEGHGVGRVI